MIMQVIAKSLMYFDNLIGINTDVALNQMF